MKAPLFKVLTCDTHPCTWQWDGQHFTTAADAQTHAQHLHAAHWQVEVHGRAPSGKWVRIGHTMYNGNPATPVLVA